MEKVIASKDLGEKVLESTGYRRLFEYMKKYGTEALWNFVNDAYNLPNRRNLINHF